MDKYFKQIALSILAVTCGAFLYITYGGQGTTVGAVLTKSMTGSTSLAVLNAKFDALDASISTLDSDKIEHTDMSGGTGITYSSGAISFDCSEVEGDGIDCTGESVTLNATGDWTGTFDGEDGTYYATSTHRHAQYAVGSLSDYLSLSSWYATTSQFATSTHRHPQYESAAGSLSLTDWFATTSHASFASSTHRHAQYALDSSLSSYLSLTAWYATSTSLATSTHNHNFSAILNKPTTLAGYGITDAATSTHNHNFSYILNKPTTLSGYGITDAFALSDWYATTTVGTGEQLDITNASTTRLSVTIDALGSASTTGLLITNTSEAEEIGDFQNSPSLTFHSSAHPSAPTGWTKYDWNIYGAGSSLQFWHKYQYQTASDNGLYKVISLSKAVSSFYYPVRFHDSLYDAWGSIGSDGYALLSTGTSTKWTDLSTAYLTNALYYATTSVPNTLATTTSKNGFDISGGCYAIGGVCIGGGSGSGSGTVNSGLEGHLAYYPSDGTAVDDYAYLDSDENNILSSSDINDTPFTEALSDEEGTDGIGYDLLSVGMESASSSIDGAGFKMYGGGLSESNDNQTRSMSGGGFYMVGGNLSMDSDVDFSTIVAASSGGFTMEAGTLIAYEQELTGAGIAINGNGWSIENNGDSYIRGGDIYLFTGQATSSARYGKILLDTGYTETSIAELDTLLLTEQRKFQFPDYAGTLAVITATSSLTVKYATTTGLTVYNQLNIPNGATMSANTAGDIVIDSTTGQVKYHDGTAQRVLVYDKDQTITLASSTWNSIAGATATSSIPLGVVIRPETWFNYRCYTDTGTAIIRFATSTTYGTLTPTGITASSTAGNNDISWALSAGDKRYINVSNTASTPNYISCTIRKSYAAD